MANPNYHLQKGKINPLYAQSPEFESFEAYVAYAYAENHNNPLTFTKDEQGVYEDSKYKAHFNEAQRFVDDGVLILQRIRGTQSTNPKDLNLPPEMNHEYIATCIQWLCMYQAIEQGRPFHEGMYALDLGKPVHNDCLFNLLTGSSYTSEETQANINAAGPQTVWQRLKRLPKQGARHLVERIVNVGWYNDYSGRIHFSTPYARISSHFPESRAEGTVQVGVDSKRFRLPYIKKEGFTEPMTTSLIIKNKDGTVCIKPEQHGPDMADEPVASGVHFKRMVTGTKPQVGVIKRREKHVADETLPIIKAYLEFTKIPRLMELDRSIKIKYGRDGEISKVTWAWQKLTGKKPQDVIDYKIKDKIYESVKSYNDILDAMMFDLLTDNKKLREWILSKIKTDQNYQTIKQKIEGTSNIQEIVSTIIQELGHQALYQLISTSESELTRNNIILNTVFYNVYQELWKMLIQLYGENASKQFGSETRITFSDDNLPKFSQKNVTVANLSLDPDLKPEITNHYLIELDKVRLELERNVTLTQQLSSSALKEKAGLDVNNRDLGSIGSIKVQFVNAIKKDEGRNTKLDEKFRVEINNTCDKIQNSTLKAYVKTLCRELINSYNALENYSLMSMKVGAENIRDQIKDTNLSPVQRHAIDQLLAEIKRIAMKKTPNRDLFTSRSDMIDNIINVMADISKLNAPDVVSLSAQLDKLKVNPQGDNPLSADEQELNACCDAIYGRIIKMAAKNADDLYPESVVRVRNNINPSQSRSSSPLSSSASTRSSANATSYPFITDSNRHLIPLNAHPRFMKVNGAGIDLGLSYDPSSHEIISSQLTEEDKNRLMEDDRLGNKLNQFYRIKAKVFIYNAIKLGSSLPLAIEEGDDIEQMYHSFLVCFYSEIPVKIPHVGTDARTAFDKAYKFFMPEQTAELYELTSNETVIRAIDKAHRLDRYGGDVTNEDALRQDTNAEQRFTENEFKYRMKVTPPEDHGVSYETWLINQHAQQQGRMTYNKYNTYNRY